MNKELTVQEAALAWAQGGNVEAMQASSKWGLIIKPGCSSGQGVYYPNIFIKENCGDCLFRLASEPPAKRYRPYTRQELSAIWQRVAVVSKERLFTALIIGVLEEAVHIGNSHYTFAELLNQFNWHDGNPCGVEVES